MIPEGHESVARQAGLEAFKMRFSQLRINSGTLHMGAFYLGNWLTDVSQIIDPVALTNLKKSTPAIQAACQMAPLLGCTGPGMATAMLAAAALGPSIADAINSIADSWAAGKLRGDIIAVIKIQGYYKFVQTTDPALRMKFSDYNRIFDARFTQYFPHEHMDRHPKDPRAAYHAGQTRYSGAIASGTITPPAAGGLPAGRKHLYQYLVDDTKLLAGQLAELDDGWASTYFRRGGPGPHDDDPDWHDGLAHLGHVLHGVEDFFSHSNFVEFALALMGELPEDPAQRERHLRRMFRYDGSNEWHDPRLGHEWGIDNAVSTGYFDFRDTLVSLAHFFEPLTELDPPPLLDDLLGIIELTQKLIGRSLPASDEAIELLKTSRLADTPAWMQQAVVASPTAMSYFTLGRNIYSAVRRIRQMIKEPEKFAEEFTKEMDQWAEESVVKTVVRWVAGQLGETVGSYRVGSHSLLSKDEPSSLYYEEHRQCAMAVHAYVVLTLTRWAQPIQAAACRTHKDGPEFNTLDSSPWIDWLQLLEFFLRHPEGDLETPPADSDAVCDMTRFHCVAEGESMNDVVAACTARGAKITWKDVIEANRELHGNFFDEADVLRSWLKGEAPGEPVGKFLTMPTRLDGVIVMNVERPPRPTPLEAMLASPLTTQLLLRLPSGTATYTGRFCSEMPEEVPWWRCVLSSGWQTLPELDSAGSRTTMGRRRHWCWPMTRANLRGFYNDVKWDLAPSFMEAYNEPAKFDTPPLPAADAYRLAPH